MKAKVILGSDKFAGKYVALANFRDNTVVASGKNPSLVIKKARKEGYKSSVLFFVPLKDTVHLY